MSAAKLRHGQTCGVTGPWVRVSSAYERQARCNRTAGHERPHREYDRHTFAIVAEWDVASEPDERQRRKVDDAKTKAGLR